MADMGNAWKVADDLRPILNEYGNADLERDCLSDTCHNGTRQAGGRNKAMNMIIAMGGDGTVHEVVNGIMQLPENQRPSSA